MKILLDTHLLLWATAAPGRLSPSAIAILEDPRNEPHFSAASIWEIAIKNATGRDFSVDPAVLRSRLLRNGYTEIEIGSRHAISAAALPMIHKDPFDRLLVAQAKAEGLTLLTVDATLAEYPGPVQLV